MSGQPARWGASDHLRPIDPARPVRRPGEQIARNLARRETEGLPVRNGRLRQ